jgi:uncharacterized membrane protein
MDWPLVAARRILPPAWAIRASWRELMARHHIARWEDRKTVGNLFAVVGAIAGMGLLNFLLAVPFLFYLWMLTMAALASTGILIGGLVLFGTLACNELFGWPAIHESRDVRAIWSDLPRWPGG